MIKHRLTNTDEKEAAGVHPADLHPADLHPADGRLADFMNGRLDEAESSDVESHLAKCPRCVDSLAKLEKREDRFIDALVSAAEPTFEPTEAPTSTAKNASSDTPSSGSFPRQPPQQVGRFQILDQIGQGGFGIVMRAYDPNLRRDVALKVPRFELFVDVELRARFLREAQAAAALEHQGIVSIYEAGEESGICYIASALCRGPDLASWLKQQQQPFPVRTTAKLIGSLAVAVHHAHIRGVLHRDLKPSNVLLDPVGEVSDAADSHSELSAHQLEFPFIPKISDFGLAKLDGSIQVSLIGSSGAAAAVNCNCSRARTMPCA